MIEPPNALVIPSGRPNGMQDTLKKTPLHEEHLGLGAKMVPFAGYEMPVQYTSGITAEHEAVRDAAGLFDISHMGEFIVRGPQALDLVQRVTVNDASVLAHGQCQYSAMCREDGGILDDVVVYRMVDSYMIVVNASRRTVDWDWFSTQSAGLQVALEDRSDETGLLAIQGPNAEEILQPLTDTNLEDVRYYWFTEGTVAGREAIISRTGYTGEDGFEIYVSNEDSRWVWNVLLEHGRSLDLHPVGLGARDSLRLEVGFPLYGNDLDQEHTPFEGRLDWLVKLNKGDFSGRQALIRQKKEGLKRQLIGISLSERGFPRPGYPIVYNGEDVGAVTSGTVSPTLGFGIAMGYVPVDLATDETVLGIRIRDKVIPGSVNRPPFYKEGSVQR